MNLKIRQKMILGMALMIIITMALGVTMMAAFQEVDNIKEGTLMLLEEKLFLQEKEIQHLDWASGLTNAFLTRTAFQGQIDYTKCDFGRWYYQYVTSPEFMAKSDLYRSILQQMEEPHRLLHKSAGEIRQYIDTNQWERAEQVYQNETIKYLATLRELMTKSENELDAIIAEDLANAQAIEDRAVKMSYLVMALSLIIGISIAVWLIRSTIKPINTALERVKDLVDGEGDLTRRIDINTNDEIGDLAKLINQFISNIHSVMKNVNESAQSLAASSEEMAASSEQVNAATQEISNSISQVASDADKQNMAVIEASQALIQLSGLVQLAQSKALSVNQISNVAVNTAQTGRKKVTDTVQAIEVIKEKSQDTSNVVNDLSKLSAKIGEIITTINGIAEQTNLLALNAAIEAARAGEQGRGFAVVAEEVRKLAEQSNVGANEIASLVSEMVKQTQRAVSSMDFGLKAVEDGVRVVQETDTSFAEIISAVEQTVANIKEIVDITNDEVATSDQVVSLIDTVATITENTAANSQQVSAATEEQSATVETLTSAAEEVSAMANLLDDMINKFKI